MMDHTKHLPNYIHNYNQDLYLRKSTPLNTGQTVHCTAELDPIHEQNRQVFIIVIFN